MAYPFCNDHTFKIRSNRQNNKFGFPRNWIGPQTYIEVEEAGFSYTDSNSIFLDPLGYGDTSETIQFDCADVTKASIKLSNGNIFIAYPNPTGYFAVINENGDEIIAPTQFDAGSVGLISVGVLSNDNVIIAYGVGSAGYFIIINSSGSVVVAKTEFVASTSQPIAVGVLSNDNILIAFVAGDDSDKGKFKIIDSAGVDVVATTIFEDGETQFPAVGVYSNDNILIAFRDIDDSYKGKFKIIDSAGVDVVATTIFEDGSTGYISVGIFNNDNAVIIFSDMGDSNKGKFKIIDGAGVDVVATTIFETQQCQDTDCVVANDNIFIFYRLAIGTSGRYLILDYSGVPMQSSREFQGNMVGFLSASSYPGYRISLSYFDYDDTIIKILFVDCIGNDSNAGTQAAPKLTHLAAATAATAAKLYVVITNSAMCSIDISSIDNEYFSGFFAATGQTPIYTNRVLGFVPADDNAIFVSKTGNDGNAGTQAAPVLTITGTTGAISKVTAGKQKVVIMDSETYEEITLTFTGNFLGLYAALGQAPVLQFNHNSANMNHTETVNTVNFMANASYANYGFKTVLQSNDNVVCAYVKNSDTKLYYKIYNSAGASVLGETAVNTSGDTYCLDIGILSNNNIVFVYWDYYGLPAARRIKYCIMNTVGSVVLAETNVTANGNVPSMICCTILSNDDIAVAWIDTDAVNIGRYAIMDDTGGTVLAPTTFNNVATSYIAINHLSTDDIVFGYADWDNKGKYQIWDITGTQVLGGITFNTTATLYITIKITDSDEISFSFLNSPGYRKWNIYSASGDQLYAGVNTSIYTGTSGTHAVTGNKIILIFHIESTNYLGYKIFSFDGDVLVYGQIIFSEPAYLQHVCVNSSDNIVVGYRLNSNGYGYYGQYSELYNAGIIVSSAATINGIAIDGEDHPYLGRIIKGTANLTRKWCSLYGATADTGITQAYAANTTAKLDSQYCIVRDNGRGDYTEENTSNIIHNLYYRNNAGYACHIKGTAAVIDDILVEHNVFFSNYSGLRLEDNQGTKETVKNNIFHKNSIYAIYAETATTYSYSVNTDTNYNATAGASTIPTSPLFISEGDQNPDDIDLRIKYKLFGYPANSPAIELADDTAPTRDAGAWDMIAIGEASTWTSAIFNKPGDGIEIKLIPVGATITTKKDGTIATKCDAYVEEVSIKFTAALLSEFNDIKSILLCGDPLIEWYPDNITYPNNYNLYHIVYEMITLDASHYELTDTGYQKISIKFARKYE